VGWPLLGLLRLCVAAAVIFTIAYLLSWQILWGGMPGSETPFHLHLIDWVATTFPNLPWWYPWDGMGVSYREAYPLASHWLAVAVSRVLATNLEGGGQVVQFALMPTTALGLFAYFDWRLRRPVAGLVAGLLLLLSPMGWVELTHFGLYASWAGMVLFMPCVISLDAFFFAWLAGDRGWRFRVAGVSFVALTTALGAVSPHLLAAPLIVAPAYSLALPRGSDRPAWRWLFKVVPALYAGIVLLSAFWLGAELQYLAVVRSHWAGAGSSFDIGRLTPFDLSSILSLHPIRDLNIGDLYSISPAVLLPALLGSLLARKDGRVRMTLALFVFGIVFMVFRDLYRPVFVIPGFKEFGVVAHRPLELLVFVSAPALAALGLFELPRVLSGMAARRWRWPVSVRSSLVVAVPVALLMVLVLDVVAFGGYVAGGGRLAYGPSLPHAPDLRDLWQQHPTDVCTQAGQGPDPLCSDSALSSNFSITQLIPACSTGGQPRVDAPVCRGLHFDNPLAPTWNGDSGLIAQTVSWCQGRQDPVCEARYLPLTEQLLNLGQWRMPAIKCDLGCPDRNQVWAQLGAAFTSPPARAEINSNIGPLDMAFHVLVGGGITHSYNDQVLPSRELSSWLEDNMLQNAGTTVKAQLAQALGIDAVVLSNAQAGRAADYTAMGWTQVSQQPLAFVNHQPSGLAAQWPGGTAVLVVGATQTSTPELYNSVFKQATTGLLPFSSEWLVRGSSPYLDDYTDAQLSQYSGLFLLGYRYHDQTAAWSRLDRWVRAGGKLFVETGWQYVDPDWNMGSAPSVLPVPSIAWGVLSTSAPVLVGGSVDSAFGKFEYAGGGWGASSAASVRPGASELVRVGNRVVAARWQMGQGRVVWSGMNLLAHQSTSGSSDEFQFLTGQFEWLYGGDTGGGSTSGPQAPIEPLWNGGDQATLTLAPSTGPSLVLFKESLFPGWSAQLVTPTGSREVPLVGSGMDFMLARLDTVPAGSVLVFAYGPTFAEEALWGLSVLSLAALVAWVMRPGIFARGRRLLAGRWRQATGGLAARLASRTAQWSEDP
jgi:hypothetical protein